jgi:hypothetical protein
VTAESIYEAGPTRSRRELSSRFRVREPATCRRLTVQQIRRWCDGVAVSPDETLKKRRLKQLLA